jgi:ASC-1-like (ASCH) protein
MFELMVVIVAIYIVVRLFLDHLFLMDVCSLHVQQPWLNEIKIGRKTVEGRTGSSATNLNVGDLLKLTDGDEKVFAFITKIVHYPNLDQYLINNWTKAAPHAQTYLEANRMYEEVAMPDGTLVFEEERVKQRGGINAIHLQLVHLF